MWIRAIASAAIIAAAGVAGGCANDGGALGDAMTTSSVTSGDQSTGKSRVDSQCVALMSRIDSLRKEGTPERIEKVSSGKSSTVSVKRASLAKMTELEKANAEFQQRCSTLTPAQQAAATQQKNAAEAVADKAAANAQDAATDAATKQATKTATKAAVKEATE